MPLPRCCEDLSEDKLAKLCLKCKPDGTDMEDSVRRACAECTEKLPDDDKGVTHLDPVDEFERHVQLWPPDKKARYFRRKSDTTAKNCGWSM